jgi:hypothetical protein
MKKFLISVTTIGLLVFGGTAVAQTSNQQTRKTQSNQQQSRPTNSQQNQQASGTQGSASVSASNSTSGSIQTGPESASLSTNTTVNADLVTTLDARKCHPGQRVVAKTTSDVKQDGHVVLRKGTRLIGHVTQAEAKTKANAESNLGIAFDEAISKKGESIPFHAAIQALAQAQSAASLGNDAMMDSGDAVGSAGAMGSAGGRGGLLGGAGSTLGSTAGLAGGAAGNLGRAAGGTVQSTTSAVAGATGSVGGLNAAGQLTSNSSGVFGLRGLNLSSMASNSTEGSIITSRRDSVHLSSGTQMLLRVTPQ